MDNEYLSFLEKSERNEPQPFILFFCSQHQGRAKRRRKGGTPKGKVLPIPPELSKGDPSCLFHEIQGP